MNYNKIGEKIRNIRENELKQTREEFAEEIGVSIHTAARLENATSKVNNMEVFLLYSNYRLYANKFFINYQKKVIISTYLIVHFFL